MSQDYFRSFLRARNVPKAFKANEQLRFPPEGASKAFHEGYGPRPDAATPLFDWDIPLSERWNKELILLLSTAFLDEVKAQAHLPLTIAECPKLTAVRANLTKKLQKVQTAYNKFKKVSPATFREEAVQIETRKRRDMRRGGVGPVFHAQCPSHCVPDLQPTRIYRERE